MNNKDKFEVFCEFKSNSIKKDMKFPYSEYTEYTIKIYTSDKSWSINKRFKEFVRLHKRLEPLLSNLPYFPKKKLFSTSESIINERIMLLENYLNEVLKQVNSRLFSKLYEFLSNFINLNSLKSIGNNELTHHERNKVDIMRTESSILDVYSPEIESSDKERTIKFKNSRREECIINKDIVKNFCPIVGCAKDILANFLSQLSLEETNMELCCKDFFTYISKNWLSFNTEDIILLCYGNKRNKPGLVFYAGLVKKRPFGSIACLELLYSILNYEVNFDCEYYTDAFKYGNIDDIEKLNYLDYFEEKKLDALYLCFKILKIWFSSNDKLKLSPADVLVDDDLVRLYSDQFGTK